MLVDPILFFRRKSRYDSAQQESDFQQEHSMTVTSACSERNLKHGLRTKDTEWV